MDKSSRREWLKRTAVTASAALLAEGTGVGAVLAATASSRKFTMDLRCGSIGVRANQTEAIDLAAGAGFESVTPEPAYLSGLSEAELSALLDGMKEKNLVWGAAGLPVDFRGDEAKFRSGLKKLPELAAGLQRAGVTRTGTWLMPRHDTLTYVANFRQHASRLRECCRILGDHGLRFGMEYVGPKTLWASTRHSFIHTMAETKDLIAEIGLDNVGFILDSWHWYTAHETVEDLKTLKNSDIVACDLNDAPPNIAIDEQIDNQRELPAATGVIDLKSFLQTLADIGYDGPIRAEPFNAELNQMEDGPAVAATAAAMRRAFSLVE
jgi:sugar phosphate isomerase/epimerase